MATSSVRKLGLAHHGRDVSAQEFADAEFDEPSIYERETARLVVMAAQCSNHVLALNPWRDRLIVFQYQTIGIIQKVVTPNWVRIDDDTDRIGDIGVFLSNRLFHLPEVSPDLMIAIVSAGKANRKRDYVTKRAEYQAIGVKEYVIVDRFERCVTVLTLINGEYAERVLTEADTYTSPLLPGFTVILSQVF